VYVTNYNFLRITSGLVGVVFFAYGYGALEVVSVHHRMGRALDAEHVSDEPGDQPIVEGGLLCLFDVLLKVLTGVGVQLFYERAQHRVVVHDAVHATPRYHTITGVELFRLEAISAVEVDDLGVRIEGHNLLKVYVRGQLGVVLTYDRPLHFGLLGDFEAFDDRQLQRFVVVMGGCVEHTGPIREERCVFHFLSVHRLNDGERRRLFFRVLKVMLKVSHTLGVSGQVNEVRAELFRSMMSVCLV
tara:strand:+ start:494 stop:1225 length:732 start_codon:yes stop_codon:yes gene_type:complete